MIRGEFYWELRACAYNDAFLKPKIMWPEMSAEFRITYDTSNLFCNNKAYILPTNDLFLLGIFSSKTMEFFAAHTVDKIKGDSYCLYAHYVEKFPIPQADDAARQPLRNEVAAIIARVQADPAADITAQERKIDELVYDLYGLTTEERDIIENDIRQRG